MKLEDMTAAAARWQRIADAAFRRGDVDAQRDALEIRREILNEQIEMMCAEEVEAP